MIFIINIDKYQLPDITTIGIFFGNLRKFSLKYVIKCSYSKFLDVHLIENYLK